MALLLELREREVEDEEDLEDVVERHPVGDGNGRLDYVKEGENDPVAVHPGHVSSYIRRPNIRDHGGDGKHT